MFKVSSKHFSVLYNGKQKRNFGICTVQQFKSSPINGGKNSSNYDKRQKSINFTLETQQLFEVLPEITEEILKEQLGYHNMYWHFKERFSKFLTYSLQIEPKFISRAIFTVHAYKLLEKSVYLTEDNLKKACILGWCNKLLDASINIDDDIADESDTRYGKQTWYTMVGVNSAILDAAFLATGSQFLLMNHFSDHPQYTNIEKTLLRSYVYGNVAQENEIKKYKLEDLKKHDQHAKFFMFTQPIIAGALYLANISDKEAHEASDSLCSEISKLIKIDDDVKGVMSPQSDSQKVCTDIPAGRPSWLVEEAFRRGSKEQRKILEESFGKNNVDSVPKVYEIFRELRLDDVYEEFRREFYERIFLKIQNLPRVLPPQLYIDLLDCIMSGSYRV